MDRDGQRARPKGSGKDLREVGGLSGARKGETASEQVQVLGEGGTAPLIHLLLVVITTNPAPHPPRRC